MTARAIVRPIVRPIVRSIVRGSSSTAPPVDLFIIVGQSNAEGRGSSASSPAAPNGIYISGTTITTPLADPVGDASTGSMWPAWSNEHYVQTGRKSAFVEAATGSTRLLDYGDLPHTWALTGSLRYTAVTAAHNAIQAINDSVDYSLGSVYFVWVQGEGDAENLDGSHTAAQYEQALEDLAAWFLAQVPQMVQMAVVRSALNINDSTKDAGYALIRAAQENACTDSALLTMACRSSYSFRTLGYVGTDVHYTQPGLNICGKVGARGLLAPESANPVLTAIPAPSAYVDTDYATAATSKTQAHTTAASTNFLVVAVAGIRPNSATTFLTTSVTFNGVAMIQAREQADNGTTASRAVTAIYYLDEATYGGQLNGVTANIVVTYGQSCNLIEIAAFNSIDADYVDYALSANSPTDSQAALSLSTDFYTGAPALTVVIAASAGAGAAAATCVLSGTSGSITEVLDTGGTNGTRIGQACIGYAEDAAAYGPRTYTATFSGNQNCISLCVASFRKRWNGE